MSKERQIKYPGKTAEVSWHGSLCIHISECGGAQGDLFVGGRVIPGFSADINHLFS